jgi:hypothetical protein
MTIREAGWIWLCTYKKDRISPVAITWIFVTPLWRDLAGERKPVALLEYPDWRLR